MPFFREKLKKLEFISFDDNHFGIKAFFIGFFDG